MSYNLDMTNCKRNMNIFRSFLLILIISVFSVPVLSADTREPESVLKQKAETIVNSAYSFIKENEGNWDLIQYSITNDTRFIDKKNELYIFMHRYNLEKKEAVCIAHGARKDLIGKNMWSLRLPTGRILFTEFIQIVEENGEGWVEYDWLNPYSDEIETKLSYVKGIVLSNGEKAWIGCGIWKNEAE